MEDIEYIQNLEKQYMKYELNGVLLNKNITIKQIPLSPKISYSSFAQNVWECVQEYIRLTSVQTPFCEFFFEFVCSKFAGDQKLMACFFADTLSMLSYNESEENKYMSILLIKKGTLTSQCPHRQPHLETPLPLLGAD